MQKNNFGTLVKYVRKSRKLTMKQLSELSGISDRHILRIEQSEVVEGTFSTINALSKVLNINLVEYSTIFTEFSTLDEYETYTQFRHLIETRNYDELEITLLEFNIDEITKLNYSILTQTIYHAHAIIARIKYQDIPKSLQLCFKALNTTQDSFNILNLKKYIINDLSYAILAQIEANYFFIGNHNDSLKISNKLISLIEETYFDTNLPVVSVSTIIFRTYIAMLNNQADNLFLNGDYSDSLLLCEKARIKLNSTNSNYISNLIFFLMAENYYYLDDIATANTYLNKAIGASLAMDSITYITDKIIPKVEKLYPKLTLPSFL